jgi:futalosine hydrolase
VELIGSDMLLDATRGCRVVVLCATESEAEPVRAALLRPHRHVVATKTIHVGELEATAAASKGGAPSEGAPTEGAQGSVAQAGVVTPAPLPTVHVVLAISGCDKANAAHMLTCLLQAMTPLPLLVIQAGIGGALPGAGPGPGAGVGDIVLATEEAYSDTGSSSPEGWLPAAKLALPIARVGGVELGGFFRLDLDLVLAATDAIHAVDWSDIVLPEKAAAPAGGDTPEFALWPTGVGRPGAAPAVLLGTCVTSSEVTGLNSQAVEVAQRWNALSESMEGAAAAHICALYGIPFLEIRGISNLVTDRDRDSWQVERAVAIAGKAAVAVTGAVDRLPVSNGR